MSGQQAGQSIPLSTERRKGVQRKCLAWKFIWIDRGLMERVGERVWGQETGKCLESKHGLFCRFRTAVVLIDFIVIFRLDNPLEHEKKQIHNIVKEYEPS